MKWINKKNVKKVVKKVLSAGCTCFLVKCRKETGQEKSIKEKR